MLNNLSTHRNYLHTIPEIALNEFKTAEYIRKVLDDEHVEYQNKYYCLYFWKE